MSKFKIWLLMLGVVGLFYGTSIQYGFSQDDYYFLFISKADNILDVLKFFSPWHQQGFPFFRPIGTQLYYFLFPKLFGAGYAPLAMHIFMCILHASNAYLVYELVSKLTRIRQLSIWLGVLYAASAAHFLSLFYIAATQQLLAAFFGLLSLNAFLVQKSKVSGIWFLLALLSKENAIVIPAIAFLLYQLAGDKPLKLEIRKIIAKFIPYALVGILYVAFRAAAGIQVQSEYRPDFSLKLVSTARWYLFFAYSAPEMLLNYGLPGMFINFWRYIRDFGNWGIVTTFVTITFSLLMVVRAGWSLLRSTPIKRHHVVLYVLWWLVGIGLIIWFPDHRYPHYLDLALIPLLLIIFEGLSPKVRNILGIILLIANFGAISLSRSTHWTVKRAEVAEIAVPRITESDVCRRDVILFVGAGNSPQELGYVLSLANGPRYLCNKPDLRVYYGDMGETSEENIGIVSAEGLFQ